jgi:hypothetical protein
LRQHAAGQKTPWMCLRGWVCLEIVTVSAWGQQRSSGYLCTSIMTSGCRNAHILRAQLTPFLPPLMVNVIGGGGCYNCMLS